MRELQARFQAPDGASEVEAKAKSELSTLARVCIAGLGITNRESRRDEDTKRQRTASGSASSGSQSKSRHQNSNSEEEAEKSERVKSIRNAAARNHRGNEIHDREAQQEKGRADAGGKKSRSGRDEGITLSFATLDIVLTLNSRVRLRHPRPSISNCQCQRQQKFYRIISNSGLSWTPTFQNLAQEDW